MSHQSVLALIEKLYSCAVGGEQWESFLLSLADELHCSTTQLIVHNFGDRTGEIAASVRFDPELQRLYDEYYARINVFFTGPTAMTEPGRVYTGAMLCPDRKLELSEYYNDFFRKLPAYHALGATIDGGSNGIAFISCLRSRDAGAFTSPEVDLLRTLMPNLQRAVEVHRRLGGAEIIADESLQSVDRTGHALLALGKDGRLVRASSAAERLLRERDGLILEKGELLAADHRETASLTRMIAGVLNTSNGAGIHSGGALALRRPSGRQALRVLIAPVARRVIFRQQIAAMILITDPERQPIPGEHEIRIMLGLTLAEARLTRLLCQGVKLAEAGEKLGIRVETARTRLKTIFDKTDTHRQVDLVRLVLQLGSRP